MMEKWKIDVPVLLIFFARPNELKQVFESVREAKPSTLLLWQDGPRDGRDDMPAIEECRKIVENIDWECTVYRKYHTENMGCDPSTFLAQKWAFSLVEKCIILEDDMVADTTFFSFCKDLLDKYENDRRINHICGINFFGEMQECPYDYLFAYNGTGAWASWRRVAEEWDETYSFLDDKYAIKNLKKRGKALFKETLKAAYNHRASGKAYWETILGMNCMLNNRLVIIPKRNMVSNVGMIEESTHGTNIKLVSKSIRRLFNMPTQVQSFPIKHPPYIVWDENYYNKMCKLNAWGQPIRKFARKIGYLWRCIIFGEWGRIVKSKKKRNERGNKK